MTAVVNNMENGGVDYLTGNDVMVVFILVVLVLGCFGFLSCFATYSFSSFSHEPSPHASEYVQLAQLYADLFAHVLYVAFVSSATGVVLWLVVHVIQTAVLPLCLSLL